MSYLEQGTESYSRARRYIVNDFGKKNNQLIVILELSGPRMIFH